MSLQGWATVLKKPKTLAVCAMLAALSVILARLIVPMPNAFTRFSIEAVPIFIAGVLFGPLAGGAVGFVADLVGCLFSGYGYNPLFCVPPILYGVLPALLRFLLFRKTDLWRFLLMYLPPVVIGSVLYQSCTLAYVYNSRGTFAASLSYFLTTRGIQFAVTLVGNVEFKYQHRFAAAPVIWNVRSSKTVAKRSCTRRQFIQRQRMRHTTALWQQLSGCRPMFSGGKSTYARFATLANRLPAVFVPCNGTLDIKDVLNAEYLFS